MKYDNMITGTFISRPNRFIAMVEIHGAPEKAHVKNTGRCRELLVPGATVYLEDFKGRMGGRKLRYSLIGVKKVREHGTLMVNMDSQAPNKAVREALESGALLLPDFGKASLVQWEHKYGNSRVDFYVENADGHKGLVEVKGCTLENDGIACFPDAPTERGIKHIHELEHALSEGYYTAVLFVIQMKGIQEFRPNDDTHPAFGDALREAAARGVRVLAHDCLITQDEMVLDQPVKVVL